MKKIIIGVPGVTGITPELPEVVVTILKTRNRDKVEKRLRSCQKQRVNYTRKHGLK